jgi:hypothetical protein
VCIQRLEEERVASLKQIDNTRDVFARDIEKIDEHERDISDRPCTGAHLDLLHTRDGISSTFRIEVLRSLVRVVFFPKREQQLHDMAYKSTDHMESVFLVHHILCRCEPRITPSA